MEEFLSRRGILFKDLKRFVLTQLDHVVLSAAIQLREEASPTVFLKIAA